MKFKRSERVSRIMKELLEHPNEILTLSHFSQRLNAAKSSISEDMVIIKNALEKAREGRIKTVAGAAGGVKYIPEASKEYTRRILEEIAEKLKEPDRIISGGFLYMPDIMYSTRLVEGVANIFATKFEKMEPDYVVTVETKGIPLAFMTARALNKPLVIIRRESKVTDGSTVSINYISGSTGKIERMSLSRRAMKPKAKVVIIDDFMKGGGTAKGMKDMMKEFEAEVLSIGVLVETTTPVEKRVKDYIPLLILEEVIEERGEVKIYPNPRVFEEEGQPEDQLPEELEAQE
ncbi:pur operon repressor [Isachenkonia alkalipeptolytica]|uniref:Pur operon repressor n=1 Tax=Isachenkonia alkalipeptolytica TaxID=2565777 RepID=A0AA43XMQ1_9CLOT|nr:pur operon repressor [Isachenkonia alkalipeptolytica]NBG89064.1 pur operon repressor [Isachenkonia alkalipeptolytica]